MAVDLWKKHTRHSVTFVRPGAKQKLCARRKRLCEEPQKRNANKSKRRKKTRPKKAEAQVAVNPSATVARSAHFTAGRAKEKRCSTQRQTAGAKSLEKKSKDAEAHRKTENLLCPKLDVSATWSGCTASSSWRRTGNARPRAQQQHGKRSAK